MCVFYIRGHGVGSAFKEYGDTVDKVLCEKAYNNYGKYFHEMNIEELNDANKKLRDYMKYMFQ
jgi:hypothetical protein